MFSIIKTVYNETEIKYWLKLLVSCILCNFFKGRREQKKYYQSEVLYTLKLKINNKIVHVFDKPRKVNRKFGSDLISTMILQLPILSILFHVNIRQIVN